MLNQTILNQTGSGTTSSRAVASDTAKKDPQGSSKRQASGETVQNSEKIPKWFKMGEYSFKNKS